ncbi:PEGA domain-containing protein [bacterium]|nr:MAG: PEGA domain-containing protein [bacterium]
MKHFVFACVALFLGSISLKAQEIPELRIVGLGELQENEIVASVIRDINGRIASGLIIESDLMELAYESNNGIIKRDIKPGRDFLFLSPDERIVTVYKAGYKPLKIVLADVGVRLRSSMVFKISITADRKKVEVPVNVVVVPEDAHIILNNEVIQNAQTTQLLEGKYPISISADGYETITDSILVAPEKTLFKYELEQRKVVQVTVNTNPDQATVFMEDENVGLTNLVIYKQTGRYPIRISKAGFAEIRDTLTIVDGKNNEFSFSLLSSSGQLALSLNKRDATILINKQDYTGQSNINLKPGIYELEISSKGYKPYAELIEIKKNEIINRTIELVPHAGSLTINVSSNNAKVSLYQLNGTFTSAWIGSKSLDSIPAGRYQIAVQLDKYYPIQDEFTVQPEKNTQKFYSFTDEQLIGATTKAQTKSNQNQVKRSKHDFVMFYGASNGFTINNSIFSDAIDKNKTFEGGLILASKHTMINLGFAQFNSTFKAPALLDNDENFAIMMADAAFKFPLFDDDGPFYPYFGVGYLLTTLKSDLRSKLIGDTSSENFHAPYYRYGMWFLLGEGSSLNLGIGYDFRKSFNSDVKFETSGWQFGVAFKF